MRVHNIYEVGKNKKKVLCCFIYLFKRDKRLKLSSKIVILQNNKGIHKHVSCLMINAVDIQSQNNILGFSDEAFYHTFDHQQGYVKMLQ